MASEGGFGMNEEREYLFRVLGRLEAKTDAMHEDIRSHIATDAVFHHEVDERIRGLERGAARLDGEVTSRFTVPKRSWPPRWVRKAVSHTAVKAVGLVIAGGGLGALVRSLLGH